MDRIGKYEVLGLLGRGGMGVVYRARDPIIGREVAVKVILDRAIDAPAARERFHREARSAGKLSHENIITIYDVGEADDRPFIVMEILDGTDLRHLLDSASPPALDTRLDVAAQVCRGLAYAHGRGVVHRDVKPENVRVTESGRAKILDFGIARMDAETQTLTQGQIGTPRYMSPEQIRGEPLDHRTDVFSFGVMLYEVLTGLNPFRGDHVTTVIYKVLHETPPPLSATTLSAELGGRIDDGVVRALETVLRGCLEKQPDRRYASMGEVATAIDRARDMLRRGGASDDRDESRSSLWGFFRRKEKKPAPALPREPAPPMGRRTDSPSLPSATPSSFSEAESDPTVALPPDALSPAPPRDPSPAPGSETLPLSSLPDRETDPAEPSGDPARTTAEAAPAEAAPADEPTDEAEDAEVEASDLDETRALSADERAIFLEEERTPEPTLPEAYVGDGATSATDFEDPAGPEAVEPEVEPEAVEPEAVEPEAVDPEAVEPEPRVDEELTEEEPEPPSDAGGATVALTSAPDPSRPAPTRTTEEHPAQPSAQRAAPARTARPRPPRREPREVETTDAEAPHRPARRRLTSPLVLMSGLGALLLIVAGVLFLTRSSEPEPPQSPDTTTIDEGLATLEASAQQAMQRMTAQRDSAAAAGATDSEEFQEGLARAEAAATAFDQADEDGYRTAAEAAEQATALFTTARLAATAGAEDAEQAEQSAVAARQAVYRSRNDAAIASAFRRADGALEAGRRAREEGDFAGAVRSFGEAERGFRNASAVVAEQALEQAAESARAEALRDRDRALPKVALEPTLFRQAEDQLAYGNQRTQRRSYREARRAYQRASGLYQQVADARQTTPPPDDSDAVARRAATDAQQRMRTAKAAVPAANRALDPYRSAAARESRGDAALQAENFADARQLYDQARQGYQEAANASPPPDDPQPPEVDATAEATAAVRSLAAQVERYLEAENLAALRNLHSQFSSWGRFFEIAEDLDATVSASNVRVSGTRATADVRITLRFTNTTSEGQRTEVPASQTWTMEGSGSDWRLVAVQ